MKAPRPSDVREVWPDLIVALGPEVALQAVVGANGGQPDQSRRQVRFAPVRQLYGVSDRDMWGPAYHNASRRAPSCPNLSAVDMQECPSRAGAAPCKR